MPGMKRIAFNLTAAMLSCSVAASSASADGPGSLRAAGATGPPGDERLSDERLLTRIGDPARNYKIRSGPGKRFRSVCRLRFYTEDRAPENYLVLRSRLDIAGKPWLNIRVPRRPNGSKGWVPASSLRMRTLTTAFEVDNTRDCRTGPVAAWSASTRTASWSDVERPDLRAPLARLRAGSQPQDPGARQADAGRHADLDPQLTQSSRSGR